LASRVVNGILSEYGRDKNKKKERRNEKTRGKRTGLYKNCRNHLPAFYTLLDTNLQELYTEKRRMEKEIQKLEIARRLHPFFASLLLAY
jgi:hypothetical protein